MDLAQALPGHPEVAFGFAAAFRGGLADGRSNKVLALQPLQGRVDAAEGDISATMAFKFAGDRHAVGLVAEMNNDEQDHELEFSKKTAVRHYFNYSEEIEDVKSTFVTWRKRPHARATRRPCQVPRLWW